MSAYPCSSCGQRVNGRIASAYIAWFKADGERVCYKLRLCFDCVRVNLTPLNRALADPDIQELVWCPVCKSATAPADLDPVYITLYLPKSEAYEVAYQTHAKCAALFRLPVVKNGILQPDRRGSLGAPNPTQGPDWSTVL